MTSKAASSSATGPAISLPPAAGPLSWVWRWLSDLRAADPHDLIVTVRDGLMSTGTGEQKRTFAAGDLEAWSARASVGTAVTLVVPAESALLLTMPVPLAALDHLDDVCALDLERATPFKRTEVLSGARIDRRETGSAWVTQAVIKRSDLAPVVGALRQASLPLKAVRLDDPALADINLLPVPERQRAKLTRWLDAALLGALILAVISCSTALIAAGWRLTNDVAASERDHGTATATLAALRRQMTDADQALKEARSARERRDAQPRLVEVVDELTRRLPTSAWVSELRVDTKHIAVTGQATNASDLMLSLARMPGITAAEFAAPVTRDPQRALEQFQIRLIRKDAKVGGP